MDESRTQKDVQRQTETDRGLPVAGLYGEVGNPRFLAPGCACFSVALEGYSFVLLYYGERTHRSFRTEKRPKSNSIMKNSKLMGDQKF